MRIKPGGPDTVALESVTGRMLIDMGVNDPDYVPTMFSLFKDDESEIMSLLNSKGLKTQGINNSTNDKQYRTVGSNHVMYAISSSDQRKQYFRTNLSGLTFRDDANGASFPGLNGLAFYVYLNSNWSGYKEVIELADNRTQLYVLQDPKEKNGVYEYKVKLVGNDNTSYADPRLFSENYECTPVTNLHEHDFSERGVEKYTFGGWGHSFLSLLRFKYSWSGTAKAMKVSGKWVESNGQRAFLEVAEEKMMRRAAKQLEYQLVFGKCTVTEDFNKVFLTDDEGRDIMSGSGIMNSGDGSIDIPQNHGWTKGFLEAFLANTDSFITKGEDGHREIAMKMAPKSYLSFQQLMSDMRIDQNGNIVGTGADKGIVDTYSFYELAGLRIIPYRSSWFSQSSRPGIKLSDGSYSNEWDCIGIPLGLTTGGSRGIELIQLRPMAKGTVAGIDIGGNIASSVDGSQSHVLFQVGVISQIQPLRIYRPYYL